MITSASEQDSASRRAGRVSARGGSAYGRNAAQQEKRANLKIRPYNGPNSSDPLTYLSD